MIFSTILRKLCPFLFGVSAWLGVYATFTQMPIIVKTAPEGWSLPSYAIMVCQIGNLGPLLYHFLQKHRPVKDSYLIYAMLGLAFCGAGLFSWSWDVTVEVFNVHRSLPLLGAVFMFSFTACTSSVLNMPYMGRFPENYLVKYLTGVSFGAMISASIALLQGMGEKEMEKLGSNATEIVTKEPQMPDISVSIYFLLICGIIFVSSVAFYFLDTLDIFRREYANVEIRHGNHYTFKKPENEENAKHPEKQLKKLSPMNYRNLLFLYGVMSALINAFIPGLLSYATLPFGSNTYHYAITVVYITEPLAYIFGNYIPHSNIRVVWLVSLLATFPVVYLTINAVMSPFPWFLGTKFGKVLPIVIWTISKMSFAFITICGVSIFRDQGGKALVKIGAYSQIGSFLGSLLCFCLVNFTDIFKSVSRDEI